MPEGIGGYIRQAVDLVRTYKMLMGVVIAVFVAGGVVALWGRSFFIAPSTVAAITPRIDRLEGRTNSIEARLSTVDSTLKVLARQDSASAMERAELRDGQTKQNTGLRAVMCQLAAIGVQRDAFGCSAIVQDYPDFSQALRGGRTP